MKSLSSRRVVSVVGLLLLAGAASLFAPTPGWWTEEGTRIIEQQGVSNNEGPANLGQLKHVATQAKKHLDAHLPGGSGVAITEVVNGFEPQAGVPYTSEEWETITAANYAPVNLGQLKAVAKPFYDRLLAIGYDTKATFIAHGYPSNWEYDYPWNPATPVSENYAPANLGQLKMVFCFDLSAPAGQLPAWWQRYYFPNQTGIDPTADPDGDGLSNLQEFQNGSNPLSSEDSNANGLPDDWEQFNAGKFAIWPPTLSASILRNQTANGTIHLRNDTGSPVNYSATLAGNSGPAYSFEDSVTGGTLYEWEEISATGVLLSEISSADDASQEIALSGFAFPFYGASYSAIFVSSNGFIVLGAGSTSYSNIALPSPSAPRPIVAPFWDDLNPGSAGDVYFFQDATHAVVQFEAVDRYGGGGTYTFQVALHSDGRIQFRYKTLSGTLNSATVGIQDAAGLLGLQMACNEAYLADNLSIDISPQSTFLTVAPASGTVPPFTTLGLDATFRSLTLPFGTYNATITTSHDAPLVAGPHVTTATLEVIDTPSVVAMTAPGTGSVILEGNDVQLAAAATDAEGVQKVEFFSESEKLGEAWWQPYEMTWYGPPVGTHLITARVVDILGGVTVSAPTTLIVLSDSDADGMADEWEIQNGLDPTIDDSRLDLDGDGAFNRFEYVRGTSPTDPGETPPNAPATISITAPQSGAIFIQGQTVSISVSATDSDTWVSKVEFLKDGVLMGEDTYPSWSFAWNTAQSAGSISITAVAIDEFGHRTTSSPIPATIRADSDLDGMPDDWEIQNGLDPALDDSRLDLDGDGAFNRFEYVRGTSPSDPGETPPNAPATISITAPQSGAIFIQGQTVSISVSATDSDTGVSKVEFLKDGELMGEDTYPSWSFAWNTTQAAGSFSLTAVAMDEFGHRTTSSPIPVTIRADSDLDGMPDDWETANGFDPNQAGGTGDADSDGLTDFQEFQAATNPHASDTDEDTMPDYYEVTKGLDPIRNDAALDNDLDGLTNFEEFQHGTEPLQPDTDDDGLFDGWEIANGFDPLIDNTTDENPNNDPGADPDDDGLTNSQEADYGTSASSSDTDGDGVSDASEVGQGSNPTDPNDSQPPPTGTVPVDITFGDDSGSHSEKYRVQLVPLEGDTSGNAQRYRTNRQYGVPQTDTFLLPRGSKYRVELQHVATNIEGGDPDYDYVLEVDTSQNCLVLDDPQGISGYHGESDPFFAEGKSGTLYVPLFEWVTPKESPASSPDDSGDGQNEFTYNTASPGVLTIDLKVLAKPTGVAGVTGHDGMKFSDRCVFTLPSIAGSTFAWDAANSDGKSQASGERLIAKATYTTLPASNSDFGLKQAQLQCDSDTSVLPQGPFEVFFPKNADNHPELGPYPIDRPPNWFYYWRAGGVCGIPSDAQYDSTASFGYTRPGVDTILRLGPLAPTTNSGPETFTGSAPYGAVTVTGTGKGIQCVAETVAHEVYHLTLHNALGGRTDGDGDRIADADEATLDGINSNLADPDTFNLKSIFSGYAAYGDNELRCRKKELSPGVTVTPSQDWANPGSQSKAQFGPTP